MKTLKFLLFCFVLLSISFSSCKKDDDDPSFEDQLDGVWFVTLIAYDNCDNPMYNEMMALPSNCDSDNCIRFTFNDDGTLEIYFKEEGDVDVSNGTYNGDEDSFTMCNDGDCVTGTMDIDGNEAKFTYREDDCDASFTFRK